ncbi:WD40 repeat domain-containing protein [Planktothrix agardhii]|uniref:WD40 repeat domain-containing protein n=1 Tax=Planktothrix agardhii TaxID=1160 RepID=UPI001D0AB0C1|nr:WD40 repeat domain-containing protein [Planktothrix agardhii]MCB8752680.1 WD40 repeat domain-containing protein [Planktothrix agardhii 1810]MCF3608850.1 WD40 repeat domain-containing protein [Planktothrix agardhii 1033]MCF3609760.1 WD40 repeat domain-containing protein [Planktothrix agardhii 1033]
MNQDLQKIKSQLDQGTEQEKLLALSKALNYGEEGLELFINYSLKATDRIKQSAYWILHGYNPYLANNTSNKNINPADTITCLAVSPDNKLLIGGSWKKLWIWYLNTGEICHSYEAHDSWILSVAISSDGKKIVSASADKTIKIWNLSPWRLDHTLKEHTSWVNAVTITPDNETIVSGSADKTIKLWNLQTGKLCKTLKNEQELGIVLSLKLDSTGKCLFCGSANNKITIWSLNNHTLVKTLEGHSNWVQSLTFIPDENSLISGSRDGIVKYWKPKNKSNPSQYDNVQKALISVCDIGFTVSAFTGNWWLAAPAFIAGAVIKASPDPDEYVLKKLALVRSKEFYPQGINSLIKDSQKECIISCSDESILKKYNLKDKNLEIFLKDDSNFISALAISSGHKIIVTASEDWVTLWDTNTGEVLHPIKGCSYQKLSKLTINSRKLEKIYCGESQQFTIQGFDQDGSKLSLNPKDIIWEFSTKSPVGTIENGLFTAGKIEDYFEIVARVGKFKVSVSITVIEPPKVTKLEVDPSSAKLQFNQSQKFRCKVFDQRHQVMLNQAISWKVSSPNAGTVDKNGEFKAGKKAGKFEIIASAGGKEERVTIYVIKLDKLKFTKSVSELKFKECFQFEVKGIDQYGDDIKLEKITWEISPEFAGKIDQYGYFTAGEQEGIVKIIASAKGIKESLNISIIESSKLYKLEFIKLVSELKFEESFQFELKGIDQYGDDIKVEKVTWKVKPEFAGIIDRTSGYFIADKQKLDTVQIIASAQGIEESVTISILEPSILAGIRIEPSSVTLKPEEKQTFFVIGVDQYNNDFPINNPKWSATDGYINGFGLVADYRAGVDQIGNSEVTVTVGKYTAKASIHVPSILKRIEISPKEKELKPDEEYTFSVTGFNQVNQNIPIDRVKWSSTAGGTINNQGVFIGGYKKREVTITVEVGNVNDTAQVILLPVLRKLKINPSFVYLELIGKQQFIVKGLDQFGNNIDPGEIEWTTTGCKIDQNGLFTVTSNAQGYFQVTATSKLTPKYTKNVRMFLLDVGVSSLVLSWLISLTPVLEDLFALNSDENAYLEETLEDDEQSDIDLLPSIEENTNEVVLEESLDEQLDENQDINSSLLAQELDVQINEECLESIKDEGSPIIDFDVALENWLFNKLLKLIARCLRFIGRWCINEATSSLSATADVFVLAVQYNPYRHFRCINTLRFDSEREHPTTAFVITPNGEKLISSHCLDSVKIWDLKTGNLLDTLEADYSVLCITITNDGNYVIASGWNNTIKMWDLTTRQLIKSFEGDHDLVGLVAISPDTNKLISGEVNNIKIWDLNIGGLLKSMEINLSPNLNSVWNYSYWWYKCNLIIPNSLTLISANHIIKKYDLETGKLLAILGIILNNTSALAITPSSDKIISNDGNKINIWSVETKISKPLLSLNSNIPHIYALAITPDGQKLVSGGGDQLYGTSSEFIIEIWDINTGDLLHSIHDYLASVHALAVTPDGTKIISGHGDGTIKVWGIPELSDV